MTGAGGITNPHIDPPLSRSIFWQVVGHKLWGLWPATSTNLAAFEKTEASQQTWKWAIETLDEDGRDFLIMEPGSWWEVKPFVIHACVALSPSVHASQEFFLIDDAVDILRVWKATEQNQVIPTPIIESEVPEELSNWLPKAFHEQEDLDPMVKNTIDLYNYGREMVLTQKSDQVTLVSELGVMERSFAVEQTYYCLYVRLHLLYLCVAAE
jgi:hypothetical protein